MDGLEVRVFYKLCDCKSGNPQTWFWESWFRANCSPALFLMPLMLSGLSTCMHYSPCQLCAAQAGHSVPSPWPLLHSWAPRSICLLVSLAPLGWHFTLHIDEFIHGCQWALVRLVQNKWTEMTQTINHSTPRAHLALEVTDPLRSIKTKNDKKPRLCLICGTCDKARVRPLSLTSNAVTSRHPIAISSYFYLNKCVGSLIFSANCSSVNSTSLSLSNSCPSTPHTSSSWGSQRTAFFFTYVILLGIGWIEKKTHLLFIKLSCLHVTHFTSWETLKSSLGVSKLLL